MQRGQLMNGLDLKVNVEDDQAPWRKIVQQRNDELLTELSDVRETHCWLCDRPPHTWVREVVYDLGQHEDEPIRKTALAVDSTHFSGPVPGFCYAHLGNGPRELAELIYNAHDVVAWGFRPTRWFVMFTDGWMARGSTLEIDIDPTRKPQTKDTHGKEESH